MIGFQFYAAGTFQFLIILVQGAILFAKGANRSEHFARRLTLNLLGLFLISLPLTLGYWRIDQAAGSAVLSNSAIVVLYLTLYLLTAAMLKRCFQLSCRSCLMAAATGYVCQHIFYEIRLIVNVFLKLDVALYAAVGWPAEMQSGNGLRKTAGRLRDCIMKRGIAAMNRNAETIVHIKKLFELCLNLRQAERSAVCQQQNGRIGLCIPQRAHQRKQPLRHQKGFAACDGNVAIPPLVEHCQRFCPCLIRTVISTLAGIAAHGTHHAIGVARFGHEYGQVVVLFNQWKQHRTSPHQLEQVEYCKAKRNQRCKRNFADDDNIRLALLTVSPAPNCLRFGCA